MRTLELLAQYKEEDDREAWLEEYQKHARFTCLQCDKDLDIRDDYQFEHCFCNRTCAEYHRREIDLTYGVREHYPLIERGAN